MKRLSKFAAVLAAFTSLAAHATTFDFSYTFSDNAVLSGSLTGDLNGLFVENIGDIHVSLNGTEFSGASLFAAGWNPETTNWDASAPVRISTDAALNNFIFADSHVPSDFSASNWFYFTNDPAAGQQVFASNLNTGDIAFDSPSSGNWSLVPVAQTPLPDSAVLLSSGLGMFGVIRRLRRRAA